MALLEEEEEINQLTEFFSYEHFYVIYCKFWELDTDHDLYIDQGDLMRHNDQGTRPPAAVWRPFHFSDMLFNDWLLIAVGDFKYPSPPAALDCMCFCLLQYELSKLNEVRWNFNINFLYHDGMSGTLIILSPFRHRCVFLKWLNKDIKSLCLAVAIYNIYNLWQQIITLFKHKG